ncbi:MAG: RlpA-like double-psi beta-barrel domain-containing protein [Acetobacteraceae bacterium]
MLAALSLLAAFALVSCEQPKAPQPRYVLGSAYQAGGVWHYPRESYDLNATGLAAVMPDQHPPLTSNGEAFDQTALAGAHATLQLPAIARLTNLETGLSTVVRINDRGSGSPRRLVEVTQRTADLLRFPPDGVARVRLTVLGNESRDAVEGLAGSPSLAIAAAPRGGVEVAELPPPEGVRRGAARRVAAGPAAAEEIPRSVPILRLPEIITQEPPRPGRLMVRLDTFEEYQYAAIQRAKVIGLGPRIIRISQGRTRQFRVEVGPFDDVARAEAVLDQALAAGIPDARIVVE